MQVNDLKVGFLSEFALTRVDAVIARFSNRIHNR